MMPDEQYTDIADQEVVSNWDEDIRERYLDTWFSNNTKSLWRSDTSMKIEVKKLLEMKVFSVRFIANYYSGPTKS
jgi:hypothetical protein